MPKPGYSFHELDVIVFSPTHSKPIDDERLKETDINLINKWVKTNAKAFPAIPNKNHRDGEILPNLANAQRIVAKSDPQALMDGLFPISEALNKILNYASPFSILLVPAFIVVVLLEKTKAKKVTDMFPIFETPVVTPRSTAKHQLSQSAPPPATPELPVSKP